MTSKKLDAYKGRLTPAQIAEGMNAACANARRLVDDAALVLDIGRIPTAASLAILAIEEAGKVSILRQLALARDDKEAKTCWQDYRSHTKKNVAWILPQLVEQGARQLKDFEPIYDANSEHPYLLDQIKQLGFYTDCLGKVNWSIPEHVIDKDLASMLVQIAKILARTHVATTKEVELWVKHLGPVWKKSSADMKAALLRWHAEMLEQGFDPYGDDRFARFVQANWDEIS